MDYPPRARARSASSYAPPLAADQVARPARFEPGQDVEVRGIGPGRVTRRTCGPSGWRYTLYAMGEKLQGVPECEIELGY